MRRLAIAYCLALATTTTGWAKADEAQKNQEDRALAGAPGTIADEAQDDEAQAGAPPTPESTTAKAAELVAAAQAAERAFDPARAERLYREALDVAPTARVTRLARRRLAWLTERSEGDYEPLRMLMQLRARAHDLDELADFRAHVERFPPGKVRKEAWAVLGDAYLARDRPEAALEAYRALIESPGLTDGEREIAHAKAALTRAQIDGIAPSLEDLRRVGLDRRAEAVLLRTRRLRQLGTPFAAALIALFAALGLWHTRARGLRRIGKVAAPGRIALALWLYAVPMGLVWIFDPLLLPQVAAVMGALALALLLATLVGAGEPERPWRKVLAPLGAASVLAAAFLALDRTRLLFDILWSITQSRR